MQSLATRNSGYITFITSLKLPGIWIQWSQWCGLPIASQASSSSLPFCRVWSGPLGWLRGFKPMWNWATQWPFPLLEAFQESSPFSLGFASWGRCRHDAAACVPWSECCWEYQGCFSLPFQRIKIGATWTNIVNFQEALRPWLDLLSCGDLFLPGFMKAGSLAYRVMLSLETVSSMWQYDSREFTAWLFETGW